MNKPAEHKTEKAVDSIQQSVASYASALKYEDLPPAVVHAVKIRVIDTFSAVIGGFFAEPCRIARSLAAQYPRSDGSTVLGTHIKTTPELAAFANSTTGRFAEYNDAYNVPFSSRGHPSDSLTPLLGLAEHLQLGAHDFITSVVLSYEVMLHFSDALHNHEGWDHTNCLSIGTAVGAGKLLGLNKEQFAHCISMTVVPNVVLKQARRNTLSMFKAAAAGQAGRAGIFAALLARAGMEGPHLPFEGKAGWCDHVANKRFSIGDMGGGKTPFKILNTCIKNRPGNGLSLCCILAAEKLAPRDIRNVKHVTVEIYELAKEGLGTGERPWNPMCSEDADHSIPFIIAATLRDGTITLKSYDEAHLWNPDIRGLLKKVEVVVNDEFTKAYERVPQEHRARVTVIMNNGERLVAEAGGDQDDSSAPPRDSEIEKKFRGVAEDVLGAKRVTSLLERLWQLDGIANVAEIPPALVFI